MSNKSFRYKLIAAIAIMFFLVVLHTSQPASPVADDEVPQTPSLNLVPSATPGTATPVAKVEDPTCKRPYPDSSIWNIPLDWSIAKIHPMSDLMMNAFFENDDWIGTDTSQYTPNMYWVSNSTPLVPVQLRENRFRDAIDDREIRYGEPGGVVWMPIPSDAVPAVGTDG
ncbi:MAG TPA: hypothetical protein VMN99_13260, partial [Anaerolineales bacterium]|nr:hypothetical protein [Anaerolineales bacterium]